MSAKPLTVGGWYGRVGVEILRGSESVAVVGRVQANRLAHLETVRSATAKRGEQGHEAEREAQGLEAFRGEALALARKFAAAEELLSALRDLLAHTCGTDSFCEWCERHAPKDREGLITGPIPHVSDCLRFAAECAITRAEGR